MENEERKLHPLRFLPDSVERPWGTVEYKLADLGFIDSMAREGWLGGNTVSDLMQTYLERMVGETSFEYYGTQFPVMVKTLDVKGRTSLHVNPDDLSAEQRYDAFGKTALWYVTKAGPDARLYLGFKRDVTAEEFYRKCMDGTVEDLLNCIRPEVGSAYLVLPGMVHAASDVQLLEIAESSELWFRLHDWGSAEREMHLEEAFDLIDFKAWQASEPVPGKIARTPQFTVTRLSLTDPLRYQGGEGNSFLLYVCTEGEAVIRIPSGGKADEYPVKAGEVLLVPAELDDLYLVPLRKGTVLLEVMMEPRTEPDGYIQEGSNG